MRIDEVDVMERDDVAVQDARAMLDRLTSDDRWTNWAHTGWTDRRRPRDTR